VHRRLEGGENDGGGLLDHFQALGEESGVAVVKLLWFLPASSSRCQPSLAGGAAGAKFLLLHFPLITSSKH